MQFMKSGKNLELILLSMSNLCLELNQNTDFDSIHKDTLPFIQRGRELCIFSLSLPYVATSCHVNTNGLYKRGEISAPKYSGTNSLARLVFFKLSAPLPQTKYRILANKIRYWLPKRAFKSLGGNKPVDNKLFLTDTYACPYKRSVKE